MTKLRVLDLIQVQLFKLNEIIFKNKCINMDTFVFTGNQNLSKYIGLKSKKRYVLKNGKIDCRLMYFPIRSGNYVGQYY